MTHDEMIEVIQAHKDGKVIQIRMPYGGIEWMRNDAPQWNFLSAEYRVKPAPKEYWMVPHADKLGFMVFGSNPKNLEPDLYSVELDFANAIHVVEVVKDE
jgi:hypothetical protein